MFAPLQIPVYKMYKNPHVHQWQIHLPSLKYDGNQECPHIEDTQRTSMYSETDPMRWEGIPWIQSLCIMITSWRPKAQFISKTASNSESLRTEIGKNKAPGEKRKENPYLRHQR